MKYAFPFTGYRPSTFPQGQFLFLFLRGGYMVFSPLRSENAFLIENWLKLSYN